MKHLLLATTALVASAGIASAEMKVSGTAEVGIVGGESGGVKNVTQFFSDWDVTFTGSGESDGGVAFGMAIDLDEGGAGAAAHKGNLREGDEDGGATAFVSFGGATFTIGDTDGAFDKAMSEVNVAAGSIDDSETGHAGWNGNAGLDGGYDGQVARLDYGFEGFTGSISAEMDDLDEGKAILGLGVAYNAELAGLNLGVGLGYQSGEIATYETVDGVKVRSGVVDAEVIGISLKTTFDNGLSAAINYSQATSDDADVDATHMAIGLGYTAGALAIGVNYGEYEDWALGGKDDGKGFGVAASYDLGGGLSAHAAYGSSDKGGVESDSWSLGVAMSF